MDHLLSQQRRPGWSRTTIVCKIGTMIHRCFPQLPGHFVSDDLDKRWFFGKYKFYIFETFTTGQNQHNNVLHALSMSAWVGPKVGWKYKCWKKAYEIMHKIHMKSCTKVIWNHAQKSYEIMHKIQWKSSNSQLPTSKGTSATHRTNWARWARNSAQPYRYVCNWFNMCPQLL